MPGDTVRRRPTRCTQRREQESPTPRPVPIRAEPPSGAILGYAALAVAAALLAAAAFARLATAPAPPGVGLLWWIARGAGFLAYAAFALSMLLGVMVSSRARPPRIGKRRLLLYHERSLLAVVYLTVAHVAAVGGHEALSIGVPGIVRALPGSLGFAALLGLLLLMPSRWLRERLNQGLFRRVHLLAYGAFFAGAGHAALAGGAGVDGRLRAAYVATALAIALSVTLRASPALLRALGPRAARPLPRARWRRALRGKRKPPSDDHQQGPRKAA